MDVRVCQRPGCGREIGSRRRRDARWCSRSCESKARRQAKRQAAFKAANPDAAELLCAEGQSLAELHQRARRPDHWADIEADHGDGELVEHSDYYDVGIYEDQNDDDEDAGIITGDSLRGYDADGAWADRMAHTDAVDQIRTRYAALLRPFEDALKRNAGVKPLAMAQLEQARDADIRGLTLAHQKAEAMAWAAREAPHRAVQAAERQTEYAALNAFGRDLPGGSRRYQEPEWSGRDTMDIAVW